MEKVFLLPQCFTLPIDALKVPRLWTSSPAGFSGGYLRSPCWGVVDGRGLRPAVGGAGGTAAVSLVGGALGGIRKGDLVAWRKHVIVMSIAI